MEIDEVYQQIGESGRQQLLYGAALFLLKVQWLSGSPSCGAPGSNPDVLPN